jgi:hypothetical protein
MTATGTVISLDDYLSTIYDADCEYVDGELIERNLGESDHSALQGIIHALLYNRRSEWGIHVFPELRVQTFASRHKRPEAEFSASPRSSASRFCLRKTGSAGWN